MSKITLVPYYLGFLQVIISRILKGLEVCILKAKEKLLFSYNEACVLTHDPTLIYSASQSCGASPDSATPLS
jgi:hypothetical protein